MITQIAKIKNGTIVLPKEIQKSWAGIDVFMLPREDSILIKKIEKPQEQLSDLADKVKSPKMSGKEIEQEIEDFRKLENK